MFENRINFPNLDHVIFFLDSAIISFDEPFLSFIIDNKIRILNIEKMSSVKSVLDIITPENHEPSIRTVKISTKLNLAIRNEKNYYFCHDDDDILIQLKLMW